MAKNKPKPNPKTKPPERYVRAKLTPAIFGGLSMLKEANPHLSCVDLGTLLMHHGVDAINRSVKEGA